MSKIFTLISFIKSSCVKPCLSSSRPTPRITWTKNGENLVVTSRMKAKHFNKMIQIPKASFEDAGEYVCTAANKINYIEHTITVRVKGETHFQKHVCFLVQHNVPYINIHVFYSGSILVREAH